MVNAFNRDFGQRLSSKDLYSENKVAIKTFFGLPAYDLISGVFKVFNGTSWEINKELFYLNGTIWNTAPLQVWNGERWVSIQ